MKKINSVRAIIIKNDQIYLMHRIKKDKQYYVIPGGTVEETDNDHFVALKREIKEELGIEINILKLLYTLEDNTINNYVQDYYLCEDIGGQFGTGFGPEFSGENEETKGKYIPEKINIQDMAKLNLVPEIIKEFILQDIDSFPNASYKKAEVRI